MRTCPGDGVAARAGWLASFPVESYVDGAADNAGVLTFMSLVVWLIVVWVMSSLTLTTGVGAGVVYAPLLILVAGFDLRTAVATSIIIQLAGVTTTAYGHFRDGKTDPGLAWRLGVTAVGGVVVGVIVADVIPLGLTLEVHAIGFALVGLWLLAGRRVALPVHKVQMSGWRRKPVRREFAGAIYDFCRPSHGYALSGLSGVATAVLGISGAEIQISALMLRCGVPARISIATGTAASSVALGVAAASLAFVTHVAWAFAAVGVPAAVIGSVTAHRFARRLPPEGVRVGVGLLVLASAAGLALRVATLG